MYVDLSSSVSCQGGGDGGSGTAAGERHELGMLGWIMGCTVTASSNVNSCGGILSDNFDSSLHTVAMLLWALAVLRRIVFIAATVFWSCGVFNWENRCAKVWRNSAPLGVSDPSITGVAVNGSGGFNSSTRFLKLVPSLSTIVSKMV